MIGYIRGEVTDINGSCILLECNNIAYELTVSNTTISNINQYGNKIQLFTFMSVRDDGIFLYGFNSKEEKNMFLKLISISGVGPKMAIGILSGIELGALAIAIIGADIKTLSKIKGLGKKTAERIVLELRESIDAESAILNKDVVSNPIVSSQMTKDMIDAVSALRGLGISQEKAMYAVKIASENSSTIEDLISTALKNL